MSDDHHDLLGNAALIAGEDTERYTKLHQAVYNHIKPKDIFEEMMAEGVINKRWEEERLQRYAKGAIEVSFRTALKTISEKPDSTKLNHPRRPGNISRVLQRQRKRS